jgi:hypothetical protein
MIGNTVCEHIGGTKAVERGLDQHLRIVGHKAADAHVQFAPTFLKIPRITLAAGW